MKSSILMIPCEMPMVVGGGLEEKKEEVKKLEEKKNEKKEQEDREERQWQTVIDQLQEDFYRIAVDAEMREKRRFRKRRKCKPYVWRTIRTYASLERFTLRCSSAGFNKILSR